jgi:hypothetical protein
VNTQVRLYIEKRIKNSECFFSLIYRFHGMLCKSKSLVETKAQIFHLGRPRYLLIMKSQVQCREHSWAKTSSKKDRLSFCRIYLNLPIPEVIRKRVELALQPATNHFQKFSETNIAVSSANKASSHSPAFGILEGNILYKVGDKMAPWGTEDCALSTHT